MANYSENPGKVDGGWLKKDEVKSGDQIKIVGETRPVEGGEYGTQDICKIKTKGANEAVNTRFNKPTIQGLVRAYGSDSKDWIGKILTIHIEPMTVAGKRVKALYFIPEGFELKEDDGGYLTILPSDGTDPKPAPKPIETVEYPEEEINADDIPF